MNIYVEYIREKYQVKVMGLIQVRDPVFFLFLFHARDTMNITSQSHFTTTEPLKFTIFINYAKACLALDYTVVALDLFLTH